MRPRPEGRGEPVAKAPVVIAMARLQCGHDPKAVENDAEYAPAAQLAASRFNAATTRRPWRSPRFRRQPPPPQQLQCGHDPKAVEKGINSGIDAVLP